MFDRLGHIVARHWVWVLVVWIVGVGVIKWAAPPWHAISQDDDIKSFPAHFNSVRGHHLLEEAFPHDVFNSEVVVVIERTDGMLSDADMDFVEVAADRLNQLEVIDQQATASDEAAATIENRYGLKRFITPRDPEKGRLLKSENGRAAILFAPCDATFLSQQIVKTVNAVRRTLDDMKARGEVPPGIRMAVTGSAGVGADLQIASDESLERSFWTTIVLVVVILLVVYRSPIVALIPLITISVSVVTAMSLMALLTRVPWMHFQVMKITDIFVIVVLFGAGTDYCLFLISRYREELAHGADRPTAVHQSLKHVGGALAASAATVVCGLGMMIFAEFGKFRYTGPAVAISLSVALVGALTLTPALLQLMGPIVFWPFKVRRVAADDFERGDTLTFEQRFWTRLSNWLVERPVAIWATSVVVLMPFAIWGTQLVPTYDFLSELDEQVDSKVGASILESHFSNGQLGPLTVMLKVPPASEVDFRSPAAKRDVAELTRRINELGGDRIDRVLSLTSPLGVPLGDEPATASASKEAEQPASGGFLKRWAQMQHRATESSQQAIRRKAEEFYISSEADSRVTRLMVVFSMNPFSRESMELLNQIDRELANFKGSAVGDIDHSFAGVTSSTYDLLNITQSDQRRINWMVILGVYVILVVLLWRPWICVYLMITVLVGYYATLGITEGVFYGLHQWLHPGAPWLGLDWKVSFFLFIILVAVGEDYNIFLMSRVVEEEEKHGPIEGVRIAVARTGGIITSCGVIMAGTFGSMAAGTLSAIIQLGFALALGVLLDTFVVRPILVPAFLIMIHRMRRRPDGSAVRAPHLPKQSAEPVESVR